jgi:hypothetical protein
MPPGEALPVRFLIYPLLISGLAAWIYVYRKKTMLVFWTFFFCINLLFSIHLIPMSRNTIVADRYLYLSVAAVMFAFAWGLTGLKKIYGERKRYLYRAIACLFSVYCIYLGAYTFRYSRQWKDSDTIREYTREVLKKRKNISQIYKEKPCNSGMDYIITN